MTIADGLLEWFAIIGGQDNFARVFAAIYGDTRTDRAAKG